MKSITIRFVSAQPLVLPLAHSHALQGLVYNLLSADPEYATFIHNKQEGNTDAIKLFCYSDIKSRFRIVSGRMIYNMPADIEIRSSDDRIIDCIAGTLQQDPDISVYGIHATVTNLCVSQRPMIGKEFYLLTPAVAYRTLNNYTQYFSPDDDDFYEIIISNLLKKYKYVFGEEYKGILDVVFNENAGIKKSVAKYKDTYITGYSGQLRLICSDEMRAVAYYCGIGSKNSMGFGMLEIV